MNPTVMTEENRDKLGIAFAYGCTIAEAALFANMAESTLKSWFAQDPDLKEHCMQLRLKPVLKARQSVIDALSADPHLAFKYLERRLPEEFGTKLTAENVDPGVILLPIRLTNRLDVKMIEDGEETPQLTAEPSAEEDSVETP